MVNIRKANGELMPFDGQKLIDALLRSGASKDEAEKVLQLVSKNLMEGISTNKIFKISQAYLRQVSSYAAGRYQLKKAVFDLGPGGYPFEKFVARLMEYKGYKTTTNLVEMGHCVKHELDVVAENDNEKIMIECKFHRDKGHKNDIKIPLYIQSRFLDMKSKWLENGETRKLTGMIVTNTRFSTDAEDFGKCMGLKLVSWDFPQGSSLRDWIDQSGYHPITSMASISNAIKAQIMERGVVLCRDLVENPLVLEKLGLSQGKIYKILSEAKIVSKID